MRRHRFEQQQPVGGETHGAMREPVEGDREKASDKNGQKTECGLCRDHPVHNAAPRMRALAAS